MAENVADCIYVNKERAHGNHDYFLSTLRFRAEYLPQ